MLYFSSKNCVMNKTYSMSIRVSDVILSDFISPFTWKQIGLKNDTFIKALPMDAKRINYLDFHHQSVFKGSYDASLQKANG